MVLWMAVRIHYRPGLLHSSKRIDKKKTPKKTTCGLAFKIIATMEQKRSHLEQPTNF